MPPGAGDFMRGIFGDLLKMLKTDSPIQWDLALQLARSVAGEDEASMNVDPVERIRFQELAEIARLHVDDITGMPSGDAGKGAVRLVPVNRVDWTSRALAGWRPFLEELASSISPIGPNDPPFAAQSPPPELGLGESGEGNDEEAIRFGQMIGQWAEVMAPAMLGMQIGSIVGHLARITFGQYELPLPRIASNELLIVPSNVVQFAEDWSLARDDARMWVCLNELTLHAVMSRPHVQERLSVLLVEHARGFRLDPRILEGRLEGLDFSDFGALAKLLGDTPALGQVAETPQMRSVQLRLDTLTSLIGGYAEYVTETAAQRLVGSYTSVREAMRRRRVERDEGERSAEALFGLHLDQDQVDKGMAFVRGVIERGGDTELAKLWVVEANLPTPAELEAPGLWIERVNLPVDESSVAWAADLGLIDPSPGDAPPADRPPTDGTP
jgi:putative hydrolase